MNIFTIHGFDFPFVLVIWCVLIFIGALIYFRSQRQKNFADVDILLSVYTQNNTLYKIYLLSMFLVSIYVILLLAGPYQNTQSQEIKKDGIDIQIVFDMSYSMVAQDMKPSRLAAAKTVLSDFVSWLTSDRVWLVLFSWKPFQSVPLTFDYDFLQSFITDLDIEIIDQSNPNLMGTALWDGVVLGTDILIKNEREREKIMILITDWEANRWVEPELALKFLKKEGIKTYTIGVWKDEKTTVDVPLPSWFVQRIQIWGIDETILKKISTETWGRYFRADSRESLSEILETISKLEKSELEYEQFLFHTPQRQWVLLLLVFQLIVLLYIIGYKKIRI